MRDRGGQSVQGDRLRTAAQRERRLDAALCRRGNYSNNELRVELMKQLLTLNANQPMFHKAGLVKNRAVHPDMKTTAE